MAHPNFDHRLRVLLTTLEPSMRLAERLSLGLDDVQDSTAAAFFRVFKDKGLSLDKISTRMKKSRRSVATLSSYAKDLLHPLSQSARVGVRRDLLRVVSEAGTIERGKLLRKVKSSQVDVSEELSFLVESEELSEGPNGYSWKHGRIAMEGPEEERRIDSLRHFLRAVEALIEQRFFRTSPNENAFARVLTFSATEASIRTFHERLYAFALKEAEAMDREAHQQEAKERGSYSVVLGVASLDLEGA